MNKLLTIVIPAYNMQIYLSRCLDSILLLKYSDELEIIFVNDGSNDDTLIIAKEYEKRFSDMFRVIDKPNGGWGSAINSSMQQASGKYFKILDADDWFDSKALESFILFLRDKNVDLVASSYSQVYAYGGRQNFVYKDSDCNEILDFSRFLQSNCYKKYLPMATITFKTSLLKNCKLKFSERYYADIEYNLIPLIYVRTICFTSINLYRYYIGREGQSTSIDGYNKHLPDYLAMAKKIISYYIEHISEIDFPIRKMYVKDNINILGFGYYMLLSPTYSGLKHDSPILLRELDLYIKSRSVELYKATNKLCIKRFIPFIYIWRRTNINILKFKY